mmetsp:Transcript_61102/g.160659  ORF Transcript_61102/g.160659 Transcript_61102/m.160659 type:complete len:438 (-) Transcript_61102:7-1320(-)
MCLSRVCLKTTRHSKGKVPPLCKSGRPTTDLAMTHKCDTISRFKTVHTHVGHSRIPGHSTIHFHSDCTELQAIPQPPQEREEERGHLRTLGGCTSYLQNASSLAAPAMALHAPQALRAGGRGRARADAVGDAAVGLLAQARCASRPEPLAMQAPLDAGGPLHRRGGEALHSASPHDAVVLRAAHHRLCCVGDGDGHCRIDLLLCGGRVAAVRGAAAAGLHQGVGGRRADLDQGLRRCLGGRVRDVRAAGATQLHRRRRRRQPRGVEAELLAAATHGLRALVGAATLQCLTARAATRLPLRDALVGGRLGLHALQVVCAHEVPLALHAAAARLVTQAWAAAGLALGNALRLRVQPHALLHPVRAQEVLALQVAAAGAEGALLPLVRHEPAALARGRGRRQEEAQGAQALHVAGVGGERCSRQVGQSRAALRELEPKRA